MATTTNPYERRRDRSRRPDTAMAGQMVNMGFESQREPQLTIAELEAMVFSARMRGRTEREGEHYEQYRLGRLEAWQEGHDVGVSDGRGMLLSQIDERWGERVRAVVEDGAQLLKRREGGDGSKRELEAALSRATNLLKGLADSHHLGFEDLPF